MPLGHRPCRPHLLAATLPQDPSPDVPDAPATAQHRLPLLMLHTAPAGPAAGGSAPPRRMAPGDPAAWLAEAWEACYRDPLAALALGQRVADAGGPLAADGWPQVAFGEVRVGGAV